MFLCPGELLAVAEVGQETLAMKKEVADCVWLLGRLVGVGVSRNWCAFVVSCFTMFAASRELSASGGVL